LGALGQDNILSCTILTTEACDGVRDLHNRLPVTLGKDGLDEWLSGGGPVVDLDIEGVM
jgi:putative SOS response-associated peptidase YedK